MTKLLIVVSLIYSISLISSFLFFSYQYYNRIIATTTFIKFSIIYLVFLFLLLLSYKKGKNNFNSVIDDLGIQQDLTLPTIVLFFFGSLSIVIAVFYISLLNYFEILFVIESLEMLILNILALILFFWLSFFLILGWDTIKILGIATQYLIVKDIQENKKPKLFRIIHFVFKKIKAALNTLTVFIALDLACKTLPKDRVTYKHLIFTIKVWTTCLVICKGEPVMDSLKKSFSYFKNRNFEIFYNSKLASFFLQIMLIPVGLSLGIIFSSLEYFSITACLQNSCIFTISFFLAFMALGFFLSYSISISLESAYYSKLLNDIEQEKIPESVEPKSDEYIETIEKNTYKKLERIKGDFWDVFRVF